jgi:hypothetical protein
MPTTTPASSPPSYQLTSEIRRYSYNTLDRIASGQCPYFALDRAKLPPLARGIVQLAEAQFGSVPAVPLHSQWVNYSANNVDRISALEEKMAAHGLSLRDMAAAKADLLIVNEALDHGGLTKWVYKDTSTGSTLSRTEGLGTAVLRSFEAGLFSQRGASNPFRVDFARLRTITDAELADAFQVSDANPIDGGISLWRERLLALCACPEFEARGRSGRPSAIVDRLFTLADAGQVVTAQDVLSAVLDFLSPVWSGNSADRGLRGDVWHLPEVSANLPIHRMAQWVAHSLIPVVEASGFAINNDQPLSGLAGYRNAGVLVDAGVLVERTPDGKVYDLGDPKIVTWRSATVALLTELQTAIQEAAACRVEDIPLPRVHGLAWRMGRQLAGAARAGGGPPIVVTSDTVPF